MSKHVKRYLGFDCGNSSIRTMVGTFDGSAITLDLVSQVPNKEYLGIHYDYWDILSIFSEMLKGMKQACDAYPDIQSFGISTWGIDFGLLGRSGELLANPLCYRNVLGEQALKSMPASVRLQLFRETGIQNLAMNSLYQLEGIRNHLPEYYDMAETLLLIPDLLNHLFTGEKNSEVSIASTSQWLGMQSRTYSQTVLSLLGVKPNLLVPLVGHAKVRGYLSPALSERYHIPRLPAISVPSHDTAAAVVSVPASSSKFAFISSGTWSLIGTECAEPIINDVVQETGFSNEGGMLGSITLLKNSCGMHILQNIKREMEFVDNRSYRWDELVDLSRPALASPSLVTFDPNAAQLYHPTSMIGEITALTGLQDRGTILASAYRSLAISYRQALKDLERITNEEYETVHIIGGGARNDHLNQMTADLTGKRVQAGPEEATSLGVIAVQIMHDHPGMSLQDMRTIVSNSVQISNFLPQ